MLNIPIVGAMRVYAQLVEAYHGVNGYGSDTAEIYAYHLSLYCPTYHGLKQRDIDGPFSESVREARTLPARSLVAIIEQFQQDYCDASVVVEVGILRSQSIEAAPAEWLEKLEQNNIAFDHRVHVKVGRK